MVGAVGLLLGLRLSYEANWAGLLQPHVAVMITPLAYLGFWSLTQEDEQAVHLALLRNGALILVVQLAMLLPLPLSTDIVLFLIACFYLARLALLLRTQADDYVAVAPADVSLVRLGLYAVLFLLGLMVAGDAIIVAAILFAPETHFLRFLSGGAGVLSACVFVLALIGIPLLMGQRDPEAGTKALSRQASDADRNLYQALTDLMEDKRLYTDSNLTLARTARRLGVPARDVSQAVNRCAAENFSRTINGFRVRSAQTMLRETDLPVTEVMLSCGFVSKSSFNTEFRRITGTTPSAFRAGNQTSV
jgi:AraC-like DNA-binding protein